MADADHPPGPVHPAAGLSERGRPDPASLDRGFQQAANVIHRLHSYLNELDTADLPVVDGTVIRIVALSEVEEWLLGLETRVRNGVIL